MKTFRLAALAASLSLVASPAFAVKPNKISFGPFEYSDFFVADCGDFYVLNSGVESGFFTEHFDEDGNLTFVNQKLRISESVYYNSNDPSYFIDGGQGELLNVRFIFTGEVPLAYVTGIFFTITLPGHGVIFHQGGRLIRDLSQPGFPIIFQAGPFDLDGGETDALCEALRP